MKTKLIPPAMAKIDGSYLLLGDQRLVTAWGVLSEVASAYRYKGAILAEVKPDLLRFASLNASPVYVGVIEGRRAYFGFAPELTEAWLKEGGRTWIIAELEARSGSRVVAFPGNGGRR